MEDPHSGPREPSPDAALLRFVERLPMTIRNVVLARCCKAFNRLQSATHQDLFATFRAILMAGDEAEARAYGCAKMAAVVELVLHEDCFELAMPEPMEDAPGLHAFDQTSLAQKHWRAAREEFKSLRRDMLSVEALHRLLAQGSEASAAARRTP